MNKLKFAFAHPIQTIIYIRNRLILKIKIFLGIDITDNGERCYIDFNSINFKKFDMYQKSHFKRYEFVKQFIDSNDYIGDMACGTGYGSAILSTKGMQVDGFDISEKTIMHNIKKYHNIGNLSFFYKNILDLDHPEMYNKIVSFETVEHIDEEFIIDIFKVFNRSLKENGLLYFSVPYMQKDSDTARKMGFHKIFYINEKKVSDWMIKSGFTIIDLYYQNYQNHELVKELEDKDFIICICKKGR